jgi:site-specific DNA-methyltransferase (adenine-specific)
MSVNHGLFMSESGEWGTPPDLFAALDAEFGFDLDAAATAENALCARFWTKEDDALVQGWKDVAYCNPPYGREIGGFMEKAWREAQDGAMVVMLLPSRTDTAWWHEWVMRAHEVRLIRGRLRFVGAKNSAPFPSCVAVFRPTKWIQPYPLFRSMCRDSKEGWIVE